MLFKEDNRLTKTLYLSVMDSGSSLTSELINFTLMSEDHCFYAERTDFVPSEDLSNVNEMIYRTNKYNDKTEYKNVTKRVEDEIIYTEIKDHDFKIQMELHDWLDEVSEQGKYYLTVWIDNPVIWIKFLNIGIPFAGAVPNIPEFLNPYPADFNTLAMLTLNGKTIDDIFVDAPDEVEFNSMGRCMLLRDITENIMGSIMAVKQQSSPRKEE